MMCAGLLFAACEKEEVGATATVAAAGDWYVTYDGVDDAGNVLYDDVYGMGYTHLYTYNTAANIPTQMYVDDQYYFWPFKIKVNLDIDNLTFSSAGTLVNEYPDYYGDYYDVTIEDGKILPGAATNPHGTAADSIVFYVKFSDDYYLGYYYDKLKASGYRYTGLASDD